MATEYNLSVPSSLYQSRNVTAGMCDNPVKVYVTSQPFCFSLAKNQASGRPVRVVQKPVFKRSSGGLSLQKGCGLWTLSCDFVHHFLLKH